MRKCQINENRKETVSSDVYDVRRLDNYIINRLDVFSIGLLQIFFTICKSCLNTTASFLLLQSRKIV